MDPPSSLSKDFSHLSVSDVSSSRTLTSTTSALKRISSERDIFTDDDHEQHDAIILTAYNAFKKRDDPALLLIIITADDDRLQSLSVDDARNLLDRNPSVMALLQNAWNKGTFKEVRQLEILWPVVSQPRHSPGGQLTQSLPSRVSSGQSESATMKSWTIKYVGNASVCLYEHLAHYPKDPDNYAKYTSIVQSSGTGKSRAIDELSKVHLVVPLNLRQEPKGFPAADENVRDWLLQSKTKLEAFNRAGAFLCALFVVVLHYLKNIDNKIASIKEGIKGKQPKSNQAKFRLLMTTGQTFSHQGQPRILFYERVLALADKLWSSSPSTPPRKPMPPSPGLLFNTVKDANGRDVKYDIKEVLRKLMCHLIDGFDVLVYYPPALILSFDEAHSLTIIEKDNVDGLWSKFSELRRALRVLHSYPCFSVFLSTTGKVQQFTPGAQNDPSSRLQGLLLSLIPPFCELGFDQLAEIAWSGETTLEHVSSLKFMAKLGRPLFAARYIEGDEDVKKAIVMFAGEKLLCKPFSTDESFVRGLNEVEKMACMSVRLALEFNARSLRSRDMEKNLVEKHMRVCLSVDPGFETAVTVAPSEPLLAEASYLLMRSPSFDLPRTLLTELETPGLDKGERGELVAMVLCLEARDAVATPQSRVIPVIDFIRELLADKAHEDVLGSKPIRARTLEEANKTLEDTFRNSKIYFNHFIKLRDKKAINRTFLWRLIARGAAALCADYQYGVDIIIPFLYWDSVLRRENVSAFIIQSKNDVSFTEVAQPYLFDMMNPYQISFFDRNDSHPVPIIRMVFALASKNPCVEVLKPAERTQPPRKDAFKARFHADEYTAFDIWCAKASQETFGTVKDDAIFQMLLLQSRVFPQVYDKKMSQSIQTVAMNMYPATARHPAHWEQFSRDRTPGSLGAF